MSLEVIAFHAQRNPEAVALIDADDVVFSYADSARRIVAMSEQLSAEIPDLASCGLVGLACADRCQHLLLCFALEAMGVATLPFVQPFDAGFEIALNRCDLVLGETPVPGGSSRFVRLDAAWFARVGSKQPNRWFNLARPRPEAIAMVLTTSGTTGKPKLIPIDWRAFRAREHNRAWQYGFHAESRFLVAMPVSVSSIYFSVRTVLRYGGAARFWNVENPLAGLREVTHAAMLPVHVRTLLALLPADYQPSPMRLFTIGAPLGPALRQAAQQRLNADVQNSYGINEIGGCMWVAADGMADALPGVDVEVVDDDGNPAKVGAAGALKLRAPGMAHGYLDPEQNAGRFVDGWFISDDAASMDCCGRVRPLGRSDALINLGGNKISRDVIEDLLQGLNLARDIAVCALADSNDVDELYIVIVDQKVDDTRLLELVQASFSEQFGFIRIAKLAAIPRNPAGKIQRSMLMQALRHALAATAPA